MCGIAGVFHYDNEAMCVDEGILRRMIGALRHRGPDDEGVFVDGPIGLGHRRLSIVDLSSTGQQPMRTEDGRACLVYNGEFYNHAEFRRKLQDAGVRFRGTSDTETLLHLLHRKGTAPLSDVAAIFGFAFWRGDVHELILCRDPLGVKQVYYHDDGQRIAFASEIKALLHVPGVARRIDQEAVNQYLHFHTPLFERTFFDGIKQLLPGEILQVTQSGLQRRRYWSLGQIEPKITDAAEGIDQLKALLERVVSEQLLADVPVGAFFSGGIDSSTVARIAMRCGKPPKLFGVHFSDQGVIDERPYQEAAAKALGLELHLTTVAEKHFGEDMQRLMYYQDAPVIGPAMLPMHYVSQLASEHVKVCLGGQAADEIFAGYARYGLVNPWRTIGQMTLGPLLLRMGRERNSSPSTGGRLRGNLWKQLVDTRNITRLLATMRDASDWRRRYFNHFAIVPQSLWKTVFAQHDLVSRERCFETFCETVNRTESEDAESKALHWDVQTYLPGLFQQDDRMSMASSLESRVPLADPRIVRFAFDCAFDLKQRKGTSKWILRNAVYDAIPPMVLNRRKAGFDTPTARWMKGSQLPVVREILLSQAARERGLYQSDAIERLLQNTAHPLWHDVIWKLVCIETWSRVFLDGGMADYLDSACVTSARSYAA